VIEYNPDPEAEAKKVAMADSKKEQSLVDELMNPSNSLQEKAKPEKLHLEVMDAKN